MAKEPSASINWSKIGSNTARTFAPVMPSTVATISNASVITRDMRNASRALKTTLQRQKIQLKNSTDAKKANELFKSALNSIAQGNFSLDDANNTLYDEYDSSLSKMFEMPSGDDAVNKSSEEIILSGNKGVAQSVIQSATAQLEGLQESTKSIITNVVRTQEASTAAITGTLLFGFNSINTTLTITNKKLDNINETMNRILEFNNKNTNEYYRTSVDMLSAMGKMVDNLEKSNNGTMRKGDRRFSTSGGFNLRDYKKYVKEGFNDSFLGTLIGSGLGVGNGYKGNSKIDFGHTLSMILPFILPSAIKKPIDKFDKNTEKYFDEILKRLSDKLNSNPYLGFLGLGDIVGNKRGTVNRMRMGAYMKDALPWNGISQKALVEVIPEYLASIDAKLSNTDKRYYDYSRGQFKSDKKIQKEFEEDYNDRIVFAMEKAMKKMQTAVKDTGKPADDQNRLLKELENLINDQFTEKKDTKTARYEMSSKMKNFGVKEKDFRNFMMEFQSSFDTAIDSINDLYHEIESSQHVYRNINNQNGDEAYKTLKKKHQNNTFSYSEYSARVNPDDVIQKIQRDAGLNLIDLTSFPDFVSEIKAMQIANSDIGSIRKSVRERYAIELAKNKLNKKSNGKFNKFTQSAGKRIEQVGDYVSRPLYKASYGKSAYDEKSSAKDNAATSHFTNKGASNQDLDSVEEVQNLSLMTYDKVMELSDTELNKNQRIIGNSIKETIRGSKKSSNTFMGALNNISNMITLSVGSMINSFHTFSAKMFGKEGYFKRLWDSEERKRLQEKLFTGEDAIFGKQYNAVKQGWSNFKKATSRQLGNGYNYLYDNTMKYMYGDDFTNDERYKKNTFVSKTLNLRRRQEIIRAKRAAKKANENSQKTSENQANINIPNINDSLHTSYYELPTSNYNYDDNTFIADWDYSDGSSKKLSSNALIPYNGSKIKSVINSTVDNVETTALALRTSMHDLVEVTSGDTDISPEAKKKSYRKTFMQKLKSTMPKAAAAAIGGAVIGGLNNSFSLLGSMFLPGGPIAGAIVGGGMTILSQTEAFKTFMFGKMNEKTQKREGGLINEKMKESFKKATPTLVGGAVLGGLKSILTSAAGFNSSLGVLGMQILPGGILGGAIIGAGLGLLKNTETFKSILYGKEDKDGKRTGGLIGNSFNKVKKGFATLLPTGTNAVKGLGIGALTGLVLSKMGYIPAMMSMGGPIGMGVVGLGLGIASSTKKFNEWMFGTEELDKDGNPTGKRRKDGILGRVTTLLRVNVIEPISTAFKTKMLDLVDWTKDKITYPFRLAFGPILDSIKGIKDNVVDFVKDKFEVIGNGIMAMMKSTVKTLFSPVTKLIGFIAKSMIGIAGTGAKLAMAPISALLQGAQLLTMGKRRKEYVKFYKEYYGKGNIKGLLKEKWAADAEHGKRRNIFQKMSDAVGAYTGNGMIADAAREGYNDRLGEEGKNSLNWRGVSSERRKMRADQKARHKDERQWQKIDRLRTNILNKDLGGRYANLTDYQFEKYRDKFKKFGIDEKYLQNSDDIMELLHDRTGFQKRMYGKESDTVNGMHLLESPEQRAARESTEAYQQWMLSFMDKISDQFRDIADNMINKNNTAAAEDDWKKDKRNFKNRMKRAGVSGIDMSDPSLRDWDISKLGKDDLEDYKFSEFYKTGDIQGFMRSRGFGKKSEYKSSVNKVDSGSDDILSALNTQNQLLGASVEISSGGEINPETIKKRKGKKFGSRLMDKFNITEDENGSLLKKSFFSIFFRNKKMDEETAHDTKEAEESANARGLGKKKGIVGGLKSFFHKFSNKTDDTTSEKKTGIFSKLGSAFTWLTSSKIGKFIGGTLKFGVGFSLIAGLGLTIAELIKPGIGNSIGASLTEFNTEAQSGKVTIWDKIKSLGDSIGNWVKTDLFGKDGYVVKGITYISDNIPTLMDKYIVPALSKTGDWISRNANSLVGAATTVITAVGPPLIEAVFKSLPSLIKAAGVGLWNGIFGNEEKTDGQENLTNSEVAAATKAGKQVVDNWQSVETEEEAASYEAQGYSVKKTSTGYKVNLPYYSASNQYVNSKGELTTVTPYSKVGTAVGYAGKLAVRTATGSPGASIMGKTMAKAAVGGTGAVVGSTLGILGGPVGVVKGGIKGAQIGTRIVNNATTIGSKIATSGVSKVSAKVAENLVAGESGVIKSFLTKATEALKKIPKLKAVTAIAERFGSGASAKIIAAITSTCDDLLKKLLSKMGSLSLKTTLGKKILNTITTKLAAISAKGAGAAATLCISEAVMVVGGGILGAIEAENLFEVSKDQCDGLMRTISALLGAIFSSTVGSMVDLVFLIIELITGYDIKKEFASLLYKLIGNAASSIFGLDTNFDDKLEDAQTSLAIECALYNKAHKTSLSVSEYNELANKTVFGKIVDGVKGLFTGDTQEDLTTYSNTAKTYMADSDSYTVNDDGSITLNKTLNESLGGGPACGRTSNSPYAQGNSKWGNIPIGVMPDGRISTMKTGGCGPTAMAAVVNDLGKGISPEDMGKYASVNGYISQGGANAGLFTAGAARLGLVNSPIQSNTDLKRNLASGKPTIISGKSSDDNDPFTSVGHIVMAKGYENGQTRVLDPITGKTKLYNIDSISKKATAAWGYSRGFGPLPTGIPGSTQNTQSSTPSKSIFSSTPTSTSKILPGLVNNPATTTSSGMRTIGFSMLKLTDGYLNGIKYNPDIMTGIDTGVLSYNLKNFIKYNKIDGNAKIKSLQALSSFKGKTTSASISLLGAILTTQYFGLTGGTYGGISISPPSTLLVKAPSSVLSTSDIQIMINAAIASANSRGKTTISGLSEAEKICAVASACRVIYGIDNTINLFYNNATLISKIKSTTSNSISTFMDGATSSSVSSALEDAITSTDSSGITSLEQLKEVAQSKKFLGKMALLAKIISAQTQAMINGTDFWTEFAQLTSSESSSSSGGIANTNMSTTLTNMINSPNNIQEELLGKTAQLVYAHESGGNYASINPNDVGSPSIGAYQAHGSNAVTLLNNLANADGIDSDSRNIFRKYATWIQDQKGPFSSDQKKELESALNKNPDVVGKVTDKSGLKYWNDGIYQYLSSWYDNGTLKDLRTLPMLADISNAGPGFIVNKDNNAWISHWTPTDKSSELTSAYNALNASYLGKHYPSIVKTGLETMKNYTIKKPVEAGQLKPQFTLGNNPLGLGPTDPTSAISSNNLKNFRSGLDQISNILIDRISNDIGINLSSSGSSGDVGLNGSISGSGETLKSVSGNGRSRLLAAAKSQLGYLEKSNANDLKSFTANPGNYNYTKYGKEIGANPNPWCNYFTSWSAKAAGIPDEDIPKYGYCPTSMDYFKKKGEFGYRGEYTPTPGDLIFYKWDSNNNGAAKNPRTVTDPQHIGIVSEKSGSDVISIEGNIRGKATSGDPSNAVNKVAYRTNNKDSTAIIGYAHPNFDSTSKTVDVTKQLRLGYGPKGSTLRSIFETEVGRSGKIHNNDPISDLSAIGFGPGMKVDAGFDSSGTETRLDKLLSVIGSWYEDSKSRKPATSSESKNASNVNIIKSQTVNNNIHNGEGSSQVPTQYRDKLANIHSTLASRSLVRK